MKPKTNADKKVKEKTTKIDGKLSLSFKLAITISFVILATITFNYSLLQPEIPLFYSLANPENQLVPKIWIFIIPVLSIAITGLHLLLTTIFNQLEELVLNLFSWSTVVLQVILLLTSLRLIMIIT